MEFNSLENQQPKMPVLLQVFLIIALVWGAIAILTNLILIPFGDAFFDMYRDLLKSGSLSREMRKTILKQIEPVLTNHLLHVFQLLSGILIVTGCIIMLRLKKLGFHVYMVGKLTTLIAPLFIVGASGGFLGVFVGVFFWVIWPIVIGLHLKHLK